jgi:predicted RNA binding protein YcfA (HicA-like mRNA interferase family)
MSTDSLISGIKGEHRKLIRQLVRRGWTVSMTGGNHVRVTHPSGRSVFTAATSSDVRAWRHFARNVRQIEAGEPTT